MSKKAAMIRLVLSIAETDDLDVTDDPRTDDW